MNPDHFAKDSWAYLGEPKIIPRCLGSWQYLPAGPAALWGHFKASAVCSGSLLVLQSECLITGHGIRDVISSAKAVLHLIKHQPPVWRVLCRMICMEAVTLQPWVQRQHRGSKMCLKQLWSPALAAQMHMSCLESQVLPRCLSSEICPRETPRAQLNDFKGFGVITF